MWTFRDGVEVRFEIFESLEEPRAAAERMSEAVVREFLARVNSGDREGAMELVSDDPGWHGRKGSRRGRDVMLAFVSSTARRTTSCARS